MSNSKFTIGGVEYDFDRCTKKQLIAYAVELGRKRGGMRSCDAGKTVYGAARVPQEKKSNVARELAKYMADTLAAPGSGFIENLYTSERLRTFAERYRKAVDG